MIDPDPHEDVGAAIRRTSETVRAPGSLEAWLGVEQQRRARSGRRTLTLRVGGALAAAAALAVAIVLTGGASPTVQDVAASALQAPERPAPAKAGKGTLDAEIAGIRFPDWQKTWGWRAVGARTDTVEGRRALTVIYRRGRRGVHYAIVDGAPLDAPEGARKVDVKGTPASVFTDHGATVVMWEKDGHTCVLASQMVGPDDLVRFVAWD